MTPGTKSKFGAPVFETEVFRKQMYCIEESTCYVVGTFGALCNDSVPHEVIRGAPSDSAPKELRPLAPPRYAPASGKRKDDQKVLCSSLENIL